MGRGKGEGVEYQLVPQLLYRRVLMDQVSPPECNDLIYGRA